VLLQFSVQNYRSIRDRVTLSLLASDTVDHRVPGDTLQLPGVGHVLRTVAVYGPNASGKSTLLDALDDCAMLGHLGRPAALQELGGLTTLEPFALTAQTRSAPTAFELIVWLAEQAWTYRLVLDAERVHQESLRLGAAFSPGKLVFERAGGEVRWGDGLDLGRKRRAFMRFVAEGCRPSQPLLAELRERNAAELSPLHDWLLDVGSVEPETDLVIAQAQAALDDGFRAFLTDFLSTHDLSIDDVRAVVRGDPDTLDRPEAMQAAREGRLWLEFRPHGSEVWLDMDQLSDGTRHLIALAGAFHEIRAHEPSLILVDELDRSLHTAVCRRLLRQAQRRRGTGQFVFTTHDTNLLDPELLAPDAIWFTDKGPDGATALYSLAEFDPAQLTELARDLELGYLQGRFGAVPTATARSSPPASPARRQSAEPAP